MWFRCAVSDAAASEIIEETRRVEKDVTAIGKELESLAQHVSTTPWAASIDELRAKAETDTGAVVAQILKLETEQQKRLKEQNANTAATVGTVQSLEQRAVEMFEKLKVEQMDLGTRQVQMEDRFEDHISRTIESLKQDIVGRVQDLERANARFDVELTQTSTKLELQLQQHVEAVGVQAAAVHKRTDSQLDELREGLDVFRDKVQFFVTKYEEESKQQDEAQRSVRISIAKNSESLEAYTARFETVQGFVEQWKESSASQARDSAAESRSQHSAARSRIEDLENRWQASQQQLSQDVTSNKHRLDRLNSTIQEVGRELSQNGVDLAHNVDGLAQHRQDLQQIAQKVDSQIASAAQQIQSTEASVNRKLLENDGRVDGLAGTIAENSSKLISLIESHRTRQSDELNAVSKDSQLIGGKLDTLVEKFTHHQSENSKAHELLRMHIDKSVTGSDDRMKARAAEIERVISKARVDLEKNLSENLKDQSERSATTESRLYDSIKKTREHMEQQLSEVFSQHGSRLGRLEKEINARIQGTREGLEKQIRQQADQAKTMVTKVETEVGNLVSRSNVAVEQQLNEFKGHLQYELEKVETHHGTNLQRLRALLEQQVDDVSSSCETRIVRVETSIKDALEKQRLDMVRFQGNTNDSLSKANESVQQQLSDRSATIDRRIKQLEMANSASIEDTKTEIDVWATEKFKAGEALAKTMISGLDAKLMDASKSLEVRIDANIADAAAKAKHVAETLETDIVALEAKLAKQVADAETVQGTKINEIEQNLGGRCTAIEARSDGTDAAIKTILDEKATTDLEPDMLQKRLRTEFADAASRQEEKFEDMSRSLQDLNATLGATQGATHRLETDAKDCHVRITALESTVKDGMHSIKETCELKVSESHTKMESNLKKLESDIEKVVEHTCTALDEHWTGTLSQQNGRIADFEAAIVLSVDKVSSGLKDELTEAESERLQRSNTVDERLSTMGLSLAGLQTQLEHFTVLDSTCNQLDDRVGSVHDSMSNSLASLTDTQEK
eukprot:SAG11_NODE_1545_length_4715_cov_3.192158_2_plen_1023_part_00